MLKCSRSNVIEYILTHWGNFCIGCPKISRADTDGKIVIDKTLIINWPELLITSIYSVHQSPFRNFFDKFDMHSLKYSTANRMMSKFYLKKSSLLLEVSRMFLNLGKAELFGRSNWFWLIIVSASEAEANNGKNLSAHWANSKVIASGLWLSQRRR